MITKNSITAAVTSNNHHFNFCPEKLLTINPSKEMPPLNTTINRATRTELFLKNVSTRGTLIIRTMMKLFEPIDEKQSTTKSPGSRTTIAYGSN